MNPGPTMRPSNPFPGLRPFREEEEYLFFGREAQVDTMVDKLAATRFLAVVGTSGSGKSSLVNCGLIPALHRGLMAEAGSTWRVATLRPGHRPLKALAEALAQPEVLAMPGATEAGFTPAELTEATLRMGKLGLIDAFEQARLEAGQNLLVVVDQFEELFRYQALATSASPGEPASAGEDATAFVNLLLDAGAQRKQPVHVVLTMRSDFLGDCAQFFGLPEAINRSQYLVPRMTRDERRSAIAGPIGVCGAEIDPVLLTRLVNDVGDSPDQLSILQHALNRTWAHWQHQDGHGPLALQHYQAIGTMAYALDRHAEEAFAALGGERLQQVCAALFKAITDQTTDPRGTRRPTRLDTLVDITGATVDELTAVIDVFREPVRSFLMPPAGTRLCPDTPIDISHESLMRVWGRLREWSQAEAQSAQTYRRLAETAELHNEGRAALLRQPDLHLALDWRQRQQPKAAWAGRYRGSGFDAMCRFLARSEEEFARWQRSQRARAQRRRLLVTTAFVVLALFAASLFALYRQAKSARDSAQHAEALAERARRQAEESRAEADKARAELARALNVLRQQPEWERLYGEATRAAPDLRQAVEQAARNSAIVHMQFADLGQKALAERLRKSLAQAGYAVPGTEQVGAVPSRSELRYFREADAGEAAALADLLKRWRWSTLRPIYVKGFEAKAGPRQLEIWLARADEAGISRLVRQLNAENADERKTAAQALHALYAATPYAIAEALAWFRPERIDALSADGRLNVFLFLTRTAPLAWDPELLARARQALSFVRSRANAGELTRSEMLRLERLLDAVRAGAAAPPEGDRT